MKLIVGLGNPGPKYALTRHNIGFLAIDALAVSFSVARAKSEFNGESQRIEIHGEPILLCKPQTYMNRSGECVQPLMKFYNIPLENLLVIHDEIDIPFGRLRFQTDRGPGGHNGVKSVHQRLGTSRYDRLRLGVGRPPQFVNDEGERTGSVIPVDQWVLQNFSSEEQKRLPEFLDLAIEGIEWWVKEGLGAAATRFNNRQLNPKESDRGT